MRGHGLGVFQRAAGLHLGRDPDCPEGAATGLDLHGVVPLHTVSPASAARAITRGIGKIAGSFKPLPAAWSAATSPL